jgi:hypothetical protein
MSLEQACWFFGNSEVGKTLVQEHFAEYLQWVVVLELASISLNSV